MNCTPQDIKVGYYALDTARFDLKCFDEVAITEAIEITKNAFGAVYDAFARSKEILRDKQFSNTNIHLSEKK